MVGVKGRSGRKRKPTAQHKAEGTYNATRHKNRADVNVRPSTLSPPAHLTDAGKELWRRILDTLPAQIISKLDIEALSAYCDAVELYTKLRPMIMADPADKEVRIAWVAAANQMDKIGRQFGWTPVSRASLTMPPDDGGDDPLVEMMKRRMESRN